MDLRPADRGLLLAIGSYLAFAKELPFTGPGYELTATFENAATLRATSPVRIAGVNVGEVTGVERDGDAGQGHLHASTTRASRSTTTPRSTIRPRLFLEGNFFLDLFPGSPSAPELDDGGDIPITQTSTAVQLDEVLTALQAPDAPRPAAAARGLRHRRSPTSRRPADDADQDPIVAGRDGGRVAQRRLPYGGDAGRGHGDRQHGAARREPRTTSPASSAASAIDLRQARRRARPTSPT